MNPYGHQQNAKEYRPNNHSSRLMHVSPHYRKAMATKQNHFDYPCTSVVIMAVVLWRHNTLLLVLVERRALGLGEIQDRR